MITRLTLKNFQAHKESILEFDPGVNVIIGSTDSGKSSIIRALKKLAKNRPLGEAFRSYWGGETVIEAEFEEGTKAAFKKGGQNDGYWINDDLHLKAFKTDVPEEISAVLHLDETNLQNQFDKPFLIENTPGEVAAHFNNIANLQSIDNCRSKLKSNNAANEKEINRLQVNVDKYNEQVKEYDFLDKASVHVEVLEDVVNTYIKTANKIQAISATITKLNSIEQQEEEIHGEIQAETLVTALLANIQEQKTIQKEIQCISTILETVEGIEETLENTPSQEALEKVNSLLSILTQAKEIRGKRSALVTLLETIEKVETDLVLVIKQAGAAEKNFKENFPNQCPLCDTIITHEHE